MSSFFIFDIFFFAFRQRVAIYGGIKMDLLLQAIKKGVLPKDFEEHLGKIPENKEQQLKHFYEKVEELFYNVFLNADEQLVNFFVDTLWRYEEVEQSYLDNMTETEEGKAEFARNLSSLEDYYFCKEGFRVMLVYSYSTISCTYLVGESVLHIYDVEDKEEMGVVLLTEETVKKLTQLNQQVMQWVGGKPFFTNGDGDVYIKK